MLAQAVAEARGGALKIVIRNTAGQPIYEQIKEQVKAAIYTGELAEGEALPSIRQLARDLKISVITTTRAYNDLEQEGFIANVQGKGCFVQPKDDGLLREQLLREAEAGMAQAVKAAKNAGMSRDELCGVLDWIWKEESDG